jgi:hypothetical protein
LLDTKYWLRTFDSAVKIWNRLTLKGITKSARVLNFEKDIRMKKTLSLIIFSCFFLSSKSQVYINKKNINADSSIRYFEVTHDVYPALFYITSTDVGDRSIRNDDICDEKGKRIKFRSGVELLNHITNNGWKLADRQIIVKNNSRTNENNETKEATVYLLFEREN